MDAKTMMVSAGYTEEDFWNCTPEQLSSNMDAIMRLQAEQRVVEFNSMCVAIGAVMSGKKGNKSAQKYVKQLRGITSGSGKK